ncbi:MAG: hypothetical protein IJB11_07210, partial [Oscillospiraceae bacterium]|nr:hypothetical protein [Oscillospiraceae bacterium]
MIRTTMKNRLLSLVLCVCMVLSMMPGMPLTASAAAAVSYIDCSWDGSKVVQTQKQVSEYTVVTSGTTAWNTGWYVVTGEVTIDSRVTVSGDVHLILADGAVLTAQKGIAVQMGSINNPNSLTIYAQSADTKTMGKLIAVSDENNNAGIGGDHEGTGGTVTITGGTVTAQGGAYGAGIGGGLKGNGGNVTIIGGKVTANGGTEAAGIGGGSSRTGGTVTIYGGVVVANGGYQAAAIGGGLSGHGGSLHIYGGSVTATGGHQGAGIGGGMGAAARAVNIYGGTVTAEGGENAAGIGGGESGNGGTVTISGGTVTASGGQYAAGIGSGEVSSWNTVSGTVTISGGTVTATGGYGGAGIGGGTQSGTTAGGSGSALPGLGGALDLQGGPGATVTIVGGTVKATAGQGASTIGAGLKGKTSGTLTDGSGNSLTLHTLVLSGAAADTTVTGVTGIGSYGLTDVKTLNTNRLYFYLPAGQNVTSVTAGGVDYVCRVNTTFYSAHSTTAESDKPADCVNASYCSNCKQNYGSVDPENHVSAETFYKLIDESTHGLYHSCCEALISTDTHSPSSTSCTEPMVCSDCGEIVGDATGHTGGTATCSKLAICEDCGVEYGEVDSDNHTGNYVVEYAWYPYDDGTCYVNADLYCADCGEWIDYISDYAEQTGSVEATDCQNPGSVTYSITLTLNGQEYTGSKTFEVKSNNHVGQFENGFCSACGGYQMPELDLGEDSEWAYDDVYLVYNAGQLFWVADYVNNVSNEIKVKLMDNIAIPEGKEWTPIMNFYGTFDGNFMTVSGLYVKSEGNEIGMFGGGGYSYGTVMNLNLSNSYFEGNQYVGGLAGYYAGTVENCSVDGTVTVVGDSYVGALVGSLAGNVYNCFAYAPTLIGTYNSSYSTVENSYYLSETDDGMGGKTAEQFASGEVAFLLQSGVTEDGYYDENDEWVSYIPEIWGQSIDEDIYPILGGAKIYEVTNCKDETAYSNTNVTLGHVYVDGICSVCGEKDPDYVEVVVPTLTLNYPTLAFEAEILYNAYFTVSDASSVVEFGMVTFSSRLVDGTIADAVDMIPGYATAG